MEQKSVQCRTIKNIMRDLISYKCSTVTLLPIHKIIGGVDGMELEELTVLSDWVKSLENYHKVV